MQVAIAEALKGAIDTRRDLLRLSKPGPVAIRQQEKGIRDKFERYIARDRHNADLRRKALTAITANMARVVDAVIKHGDDYRPFVEGPVPGGRTPLNVAVRA